MGPWAIMALNAALAVGCCFVIAKVVTEIGAEALEPVAVESGLPALAEEADQTRAAAPSLILDRNLFGAQLAGDVQVVDEKERDVPLTATKLPLRLLGTAAASQVERSRAAIEDEKTRKHMVVAVGDRLEGHSRVRVDAIERTRVILDNAGRPEELALFDEPKTRPARPARRASPRQARRAARAESGDKLGDRLKALSGEDGQGISRLLSQARIVPNYVDGEMTGMKVDAIKDDSLFQRVGLVNGDVITEVNGIVIDRPEAASAIFDELASADTIDIAAMRGDSPVNMSAEADDLVEQD
jgi:general secretion pathway protein C